MSEQIDPKNDDPTFSELKKIPLWIKVMWVLGITWVISYIFLGLQHTSTTW